MTEPNLKPDSQNQSEPIPQASDQLQHFLLGQPFWTRRAFLDLLTIVILSIAVFVIADKYEIFDLIVQNVMYGEHGDLDEILVVLGFLAVALIIFSMRRWAELKREVNTHKQTQSRLQLSEKKYHVMFSNAQHGMIILDPDTLAILEANSQACEIYGYSQKEFVEQSLKSLAKDPKTEIDILHSHLISQKPFRVSHLRKNGAEIIVEILVSRVDYEGRSAFLSVHRDITRKAGMEAALRESEERYRLLTETAEDIIFTLDRSGQVTFINAYGAKQIDSKPEQIIGKRPDELLPAEAITEHEWMFRKVFKTGKSLAMEIKIPLFNRSIWVNTHLVPLKSVDGQVQTILGYARDVTENKRSFEALQRRDAILEAIGTTTERFLQLNVDNYRTPLGEILESLGKASGAEHAYFIELVNLHSSGPILDMIAEWHRPGSIAHSTGTGHTQIPLPPGFEQWENILIQGMPIQGRTSSFPEEEARLLGGFGIRSIVVVPIHTGNTLWGLLGFDNCLDEDEECPPALLDAFKTAAGAMGAAVRRVLAKREIQRQLTRLAALREIDTAILGSVDLKLTLNILLSKVTEQLDMDAATILLYNPTLHRLDYAACIGFRFDALKHTQLEIGKGYAGKAGLEQKMIYVADLRNHAAAFLQSPQFSGEEFIAYYAVPLVAKGKLMGVMEIFRRSLEESRHQDDHFIEALAGQAAIAIEMSQLFEQLLHSNNELKKAYDDTLLGLSLALEYRDDDTEGHTQRVTDLAVKLGRAMNVRDQDLTVLYQGSLLHDIGKIGIPDYILLKPGPLTEEEWKVMKKHPVYAYEMLKKIPFLQKALDIPYCHHEKWDGSGYPRGLKGEQIPLGARIFSIVDVWDALTSDRPYRLAWPKNKALQYIREQSGKHFDPKVVDHFLELTLNL